MEDHDRKPINRAMLNACSHRNMLLVRLEVNGSGKHVSSWGLFSKQMKMSWAGEKRRETREKPRHCSSIEGRYFHEGLNQLSDPQVRALKLPRGQQRTKDLSSLTNFALPSWPVLATISAISCLLCFTDQRGPSKNSTTDCQSKGICRMYVLQLLARIFSLSLFLSSTELLDYSKQVDLQSQAC